MADLHVKDISYAQGKNPGIKGHIEAGNPALIIRAYNGHRADPTFADNRKAAHDAGVVELGIYAYIETVQRKSKKTGKLLPPPLPIADQAKGFLKVVGDWAPNEFPMIDIEEGAKSPARARPDETWLEIVEAVTLPAGTVAIVYSGLNYAQNHNLKERVREAARRSSPRTDTKEPGQDLIRHDLWQHSNGTDPKRNKKPGHVDPQLGAVDCSIFHGSIEDLTALVHPTGSMGLTSLEEPMKLDQDDLAAIADLISKGVGDAMLGAKMQDPLKDDKTETNVATTLRTLRRQVDLLANRSSADIAKAVVAALPQQQDASRRQRGGRGGRPAQGAGRRESVSRARSGRRTGSAGLSLVG